MTDYPESVEKKKQQEVESFWNAKPCDSDTSQRDLATASYFREVESHRYALQPHILELLEQLDLDGKAVLEIGTGTGTDARTIIGLGASYTGINVDAGSTDLTRSALEVFGLPGDLRQASALNIPYPDNSFDVVYSFGVLHHIPQVGQAIDEIRRVLKPSGMLAIMLYNKDSINYRVEILHLRKWGLYILGLPGVVHLLEKFGLPRQKIERHLQLQRSVKCMSDEEWLSRNTDGPDNPYSRVYGEIEARNLLADFEDVEQQIRFFDYRHWGALGKHVPDRVLGKLGERWGWHRIVIARKSSIRS